MPLLPITASIAAGGTLVRFGRTTTQPGPVSTVPGTVSAATVSNVTSTSAQLNWGPPANNGGSAITGYSVSRDGTGGTTVVLDAAARSYQFLNLTASTTYHLSVSAINSVGTGTARTITVTTAGSPGPVGARFPGDPQPKATRKLYWGSAEPSDNPPTAHEAAAGVPVGCRRTYFTESASLAAITPPGGALLNRVSQDHTANRLPVVSWRINQANWAAGANGAYDSYIDALIPAVEAKTKPAVVIANHEPENDGGTAANFRAWQQRIRARINVYTAAHGPLKRLVFGGCLMDWTGDPKSGRSITDWWPGAGVWDVLGIDVYAFTSGNPIETPGFTNLVNFCASHSQPWGIPEWGLQSTAPAGGQQISDFFNHMTDGLHDCVYMAYYDLTPWTLTDNNGALTAFNTIMADPRAIHLSDLGY